MVSNPDLVELNNPDLAELKHRSFSSCLIKQGLPLEVAISSSSLILCSHTIFEDATPELGRDFFWDGDFPLNWDPMLAYSKTLDEIRQNGATVPLDKKSFHSFAVTVKCEYIFGGCIQESRLTIVFQSSGGCRMRIKGGLKQWRCGFVRIFNGDLKFLLQCF